MTNKEKVKEIIKKRYEIALEAYEEHYDEKLFADLAESTGRSTSELKKDYWLCTNIEYEAIYEKVDSLSPESIDCLLRVLTDYEEGIES